MSPLTAGAVPSRDLALAVEARGLGKRFRGVDAVTSLDLRVPSGSVFGFLGPNGAGKTTTIRMLLGLARPSSGEAFLLGEPVGPASAARRRVGFLPDVPAFYGWMKAGEYLEFAGRLFGMERQALRRRAAELLEFTGLAGVKTRISGFSRGMKQRLGLAQALINQPDLLILDEPTSALDPLGRREVLEAIKALRVTTTVFFSTHILADVERVCDRVAILDRGRLVAEETIAGLKARYSRPAFRLRLEAGTTEFAAALRGLDWVEKVELAGDELRILVSDAEAGKVAIPGLIAQRGLALARFEVSEPTLEDVFVKVVGEA